MVDDLGIVDLIKEKFEVWIDRMNVAIFQDEVIMIEEETEGYISLIAPSKHPLLN